MLFIIISDFLRRNLQMNPRPWCLYNSALFGQRANCYGYLGGPETHSAITGIAWSFPTHTVSHTPRFTAQGTAQST